MQTALQFGPILVHLDRLLLGLVQTIQLAVLSILFGTAIGILGAVGRRFGPRWLAWPIAAYVELIPATHHCSFSSISYFSRFFRCLASNCSNTAAVVVVNSSRCSCDGDPACRHRLIPEGQIEAAKSLGLSRYRIIRHVILVPAVRAVYPSRSAQFVLQIMGTSIVGAIAAEELPPSQTTSSCRHSAVSKSTSSLPSSISCWFRPRASSSLALASSCFAGRSHP